MPNDVITQLRAYLDYASGESVEEMLAVPSPGEPVVGWYRRGPVLAGLAAVLVLAVGVPALLLTSDPRPPVVSELPDPLDVGVERVWPDVGFFGGPDEIAAAFAEQALAWTDVETVSDPDASPDGPVWTTIRHGDRPDLEVLSVPIGDGLRVLIQVGAPGLTVGPADNGSGQRIGITRAPRSDSAVLHIRFVEPDRVEVVSATASDLEQGQIRVDSDSPIGGIVAVYSDAEGEAVTAVGAHFGPFDTPVTPTETTISPLETFPATSTDIGFGWEAIELPSALAFCHQAVVATDEKVVFWGGNATSCDYGQPVGDPALAYNPDTGIWRQLPPSPLNPAVAPTGVWTGSEILICCGIDSIALDGGREIGSNQAAAYHLLDGVWRSLPDAPLGGPFPMSVWTGSEMMVVTQSGVAAYDPSTDAWRTFSEPPGPLGRTNEIAWTGSELIVWPSSVVRRVFQGVALDPASDTWRTLPDPPAWPAALDMVYADGTLFVWGGLPAERGSERAVGSRLDLITNEWTELAEALPEPQGCECNLGSQTLTWTGEYLLVSPGFFSTGLNPTDPVLIAYNPATDIWILVDEETPTGLVRDGLTVGNRILLTEDVVTDSNRLFVSPDSWHPTGDTITPDTWNN